MKWIILIMLAFSSSELPAQSTWYQIDVGTTKDLRAISFGSNIVGYIAGEDSLILKTTDGGKTWFELDYSGIALSLGVEFTDIEFLSENKGYILTGQNGSTYKTSDGGLNWTSIGSLSSICWAETMYIFSEDNGIIGGSGCFIGEQIDVLTTGSVSAAILNSPGWDSSERIMDIDFLDNSFGLAASSGGRLYRTTDGGLNWDSIPSSLTGMPLTSVQILDSDTAFAGYIASGGGFGMLKSVDGGINWFMDLSAATFWYPDFHCMEKDGGGTIYCGAEPSFGLGGLMFEKKAEAGWTFTNIDKAVNDIDSYSGSIAWAIGDSGYVIVNVNPINLGIAQNDDRDSKLILYPNLQRNQTY